MTGPRPSPSTNEPDRAQLEPASLRLRGSDAFGVITVRLDGTIDEANDVFLTMLGYTRDDLQAGLDWRALTPPEWAEQDEQLVAMMRRTGASPPFEKEYRRKDGSRVPVLIGAVMSGAVAIAYVIDLSERRRAEERSALLARLSDALANALDRDETLDAGLRVLVPAVADIMLVSLFDEEGRFILAAARHADPELDAELQTLRGKTYRSVASPSSVEAIGQRHAVIVPDPTEAQIRSVIEPAYAELFLRFGGQSRIIAPLVARGRVRGILVAMRCGETAPYTASDLPFLEEVGARIAPALGNAEAYERERRIAASFQNAALPRSLPPIPGVRFDALYVPGRAEALVGGDFYDAFRLPDGRVVLSVGDVAGSGLGAAATMATVRQSIRGAAGINPDPQQLLAAADFALVSQEPSTFVTAWVGVLDPIEGVLAFASAGHPPPVLLRAAGAPAFLPPGGLPLGLRALAAYRDEGAGECRMEAGCALVLYTDGLLETDREPQQAEGRLLDAVAALTPEEPARHLYEHVLHGSEPRDDIALLVVRFDLAALRDRGGAWVFDSADAVAAGRARASIGEALRAAGFDEAAVLLAELVFAELLGNVVRYAGGEVEVLLETDAALPVLHVLDRGAGFDFNPKLPNDALSERGRGLYIVRMLTSEFSVSQRSGGGSHARAVLDALSADRAGWAPPPPGVNRH